VEGREINLTYSEVSCLLFVLFNISLNQRAQDYNSVLVMINEVSSSLLIGLRAI